MFYILLFTYLLGAFTFVPFLIFLLAAALYYSSPPANSYLLSPSNPKQTGPSSQKASDLKNTKDDLDPDLPKLYRAGWLTVRQSYETTQNGDGSYMGMLTSSYRTFMDQRSKDAKRARPKDQFYTVLKQNVLFLYEDEDQVDCAAAIEVTLYDITLHPEGSPDGELFVKRRAICLRPQIQSIDLDSSSLLNEKKSPSIDEPRPVPERKIAGQPLPWFIFTKTNVDKEDWYHVLVASSKLSGPHAKATFAKDASLFDPDDMAKLVEGIDQQPDPIPMRWMNAMLGRLFLSTYRTRALETVVIERIMKKLEKVQTPTFLSAIQVREVNVGSSTPFFSKPMLKELTIDGDASMEVHMTYTGEFRITIETVATINLGARFKPYVVNLVLAVVLKELTGTLLLKIKKPPSNRLWFGFTAMPHLVLELEPVVSTRQIKWAMVLKPIESRIREVVLESIVYPNLDDLVFFDSQAYLHHGGIWGDAARTEHSMNTTHGDHASDATASGEESREKTREGPLARQKSSSRLNFSEPQNQSLSASSSRDQTATQSDATLRLRTPAKSLTASDLSSEPTGLAAGEAPSPNPISLLNPLESRRSSWFSTSRRQDTVSSMPVEISPRLTNKNRPVRRSSDLEDAEAVAKLQEVLRLRAESTRTTAPSLSSVTSDLGYISNSLTTPTLNESSKPERDELEPSTSTTPPAPNHNHADSQSKPANISHRNEFQLTDDHATHEHMSQSASTSLAEEASTSAPVEAGLPLRRLPPPPPPRQPFSSSSMAPPQRNPALPLRSPDGPSTLAVSNNSTANSILNQLRTRATDKEALAASVTQAKDVVKKWGASWAAKRKSPQNNLAYPYSSGFNPISIEDAQSLVDIQSTKTSTDGLSSLAETADMDISPVNDSPPQMKTSSNSQEESQASRSYRSHRAAMGKLDHDAPSSPQRSYLIATSPPSQDGRPGELRHKNSHSKLNLPSGSEDGSGKRNRIISSNGLFIPAAPQSTTGLSIPSSQIEGSSSTAEPSTTSGVAEKLSAPGTPVAEPGGPNVLSERAIYKPAPMMAIPGIKDSSHRFALGSDSLGQPSRAEAVGPGANGASPPPVIVEEGPQPATSGRAGAPGPDDLQMESPARGTREGATRSSADTQREPDTSSLTKTAGEAAGSVAQAEELKVEPELTPQGQLLESGVTNEDSQSEKETTSTSIDEAWGL